MNKKHNFFAGPAILPEIVLQEASAAAKLFGNTGLSILELSHRSKDIVDVMDEADDIIRELLHLPDSYKVLFLTGGASSQFYMSAMNLLNKNEKVAFVDTGTWSSKAIKEAEHFGEVNIIASSKDKNFNYIPKDYSIPTDAKYLHLTSNNTIYGTQLKEFPNSPIPIVCDMSSDIFSKPIDINKFQMIYAGAQKNLGPAGTTLVIVNEEFLGRVERDIPTMLDYRTHIAKKSSFNTPPVFPIYVCLLTLRWIKQLGGLEEIARKNQEKAAILYEAIDRNPLFKGATAFEDRSLMNVCFLINDEAKKEAFMNLATEADCVGIKGHRSVGGFRASIYNAMQIESVKVLVDVMDHFAEKYS